jgi:hypothetical protein
MASASSHEMSGVSLLYMVAIDHPIWPHACWVLYLMTVLHAASMLKTHGWNAIYLSLNQTLCKPFWLCLPIMPHTGTKSGGWWRDYFSDHPGLKAKQTDTYAAIWSSAPTACIWLLKHLMQYTLIFADWLIPVNAVPLHWQSAHLVDEIESYCEYLDNMEPRINSNFWWTWMAVISHNKTPSSLMLLWPAKHRY